MGGSFKVRHGCDWPAEMPDVFIDMTVAKKWRQFRSRLGIEFSDPWVPLIDAARALVPEEWFKVAPWTEEHFHDWVMAEKGCVTWGCASCGKFTLLTEPVFTSSGATTVGSLSVGDYIIAATGHPARVEKIFEQDDRPLYIVRFGDGTETVCGDEHLWTVRYWGRVRWEGPRKTRKAMYGFVTRTMTTERLASWTDLKRRRASIPLTEPVEFDRREVPVDPYVLGCLIGDGSLCGAVSLTSHPDDAELRERFRQGLAVKFPGYELRAVKGGGTAWLVTGRGRGRANAVKTALRDLGLFGHRAETKFVPDLYKFNSADVRFELLAGLFDTDGTVSKKGHVSYCTASKRLAEDVRFLLQSVGASVTVYPKTPVYTHDGTRREGQTAYTVFVHGLKKCYMRRLFHLSRKRNRICSLRTEGYKSIESVTRVADRSSYPSRTRCITLAKYDVAGNPVEGLYPIGNFTVTHNSNDYGLLMLLDWITDPFDTVIRLGSTDKQSLKSRSWNAVVTYFAALKRNRLGLAVPGKFSKSGYAILNDGDDDSPESVGEKAGIVGVAVNDSEDSGKLQGAHAKYVRLVIDELATITHHDNIRKAMQNLRVGALDFRFFALANPASWDDESCRYCVPPGGPDSVNVDTGLWTSARGFLVRHHDGLKCVTVTNPEKAAEFPFLLTREVVAQNLADCDGNEDAPVYWQMVRGFPAPAGTALSVVLDPRAAARCGCSEDAGPFDPSRFAGAAAGVDPAWSEGGDMAARALCRVLAVPGFPPILDFGGSCSRLHIRASDPRPPVLQMREQVLAAMRAPYEAPFSATAVDSSGNQGLADDLMIYAGADCLSVNSSVKASELPLRAGDPRPARETVKDRGTEAWWVLAEFCRAGQVRGLPKEAVRALTSRRLATRGKLGVAEFPYRLEPKREFNARFGGSPNEADACALAALAVKERLGVLPYGYLPSRPSAAAVSGSPEEATAAPPLSVEAGAGEESYDSSPVGLTDAREYGIMSAMEDNKVGV